ncbi:MAG: methionine--tRNA ligase subunit beta [Planctomycetes bacterium]|nr:methionine--tRNA ligase subunit beta [Planctomycetota bacterium]
MGVQIPTIPFEDFSRLDLRVATVKAAEVHPNADRLLRITLDDGTASGRQVLAGIRGFYDPAQLVGKQVVIVANLQPRKIRGELSEGMILAAVVAGSAGGGESDVVLVTLDRPVPAGSAVS